MKKLLASISFIILFLCVSGQGDTVVKDYNYYKAQYDRGTIMRNVGRGLVISGPFWVGLGFGIGIMAINGTIDDNVAISIWASFLTIGILAEVIGIPLWIAGGTKRVKSLRNMDELGQNPILSFGPTKHGIGLILRF